MDEFSIIIESKKPEPKEVVINLSRLSRASGYSVSHLSRVFSQETTPSVNCLIKLASALGMGMDQLHEMIKGGNIRAAKIS